MRPQRPWRREESHEHDNKMKEDFRLIPCQSMHHTHDILVKLSRHNLSSFNIAYYLRARAGIHFYIDPTCLVPYQVRTPYLLFFTIGDVLNTEQMISAVVGKNVVSTLVIISRCFVLPWDIFEMQSLDVQYS